MLQGVVVARWSFVSGGKLPRARTVRVTPQDSRWRGPLQWRVMRSSTRGWRVLTQEHREGKGWEGHRGEGGEVAVGGKRERMRQTSERVRRGEGEKIMGEGG